MNTKPNVYSVGEYAQQQKQNWLDNNFQDNI